MARAQALAGDSKLDPAVREFLGQALQAALPPVRHEFTVSGLAKYQAPDDANLVRIKVYSDTVELEFDGQTYSSPFAIDPKLLQRLAPVPSAYGRVLFNAIFSDKKSPAGLQGSDTRVGYLTRAPQD